MSSHRLAFVQDYVPRYRIAFFNLLVQQLQEEGIECRVLAGRAPESNAARGDEAPDADWFHPIGDPFDVWPIRLGPRVFMYGTDRHWRDFDGVVMGLRGASLDLDLELIRKRSTGRRIGVFGHLSRFVKPPNAIDLAIERWQMKRSDHVFAYTEQGRDVAISTGVSPAKVTAVMNSLDVSDLLNAYRRLDEVEVSDFILSHSLVPGKTFGYIGGLDSPKRIDFLAEAMGIIWGADREVKVIVAGRGADERLLSKAVERGQVIIAGYAGAASKARIMRVSNALVNPGRIGLLAVESLAVGIPILTTDWEYHAPEYDYLHVEHDVFASRNDPKSFAELLLKYSLDDRRLPVHWGREYPTIEAMVGNFVSGIKAMYN